MDPHYSSLLVFKKNLGINKKKNKKKPRPHGAKNKNGFPRFFANNYRLYHQKEKIFLHNRMK